MSYGDLVYDEHVDAYDYCREAMQLFDLYQTCVGRKQIDTMLKVYVNSLNAVKLLPHGFMYFIPRDHTHHLDEFEVMFEMLEAANQNKNAFRLPLYVNSMNVVDDAKKREYEDVLRCELTDLDDELASLGYLAEELTIRARGLHMRKAAA